MPTSTIKSPKLDLNSLRSEVVGIGTTVPVLGGGSRQYIFFDNAASTPALIKVLQTVNNFMPWYSSVHRGSGLKSQIATRAFDEARETVLNFFGANQQDHIAVFGRNTTDAINKLSYRLNLSKNDVVLIGHMEHHSNDLPWRRTAEVHRLKVDEQGSLIESDLKDKLAEFSGRVKLIAISGGSNVTGFLPDIHRIARLAHAAGAQILVDGAQLAPHRKVEVKPLSSDDHIDYLSVSAHKMYAPFGTGVLIGRRDTFETGAPEICGGGTIKVVTDNQVVWADAPDRDEAGTPNVVGVVALAAALKFLDSIGMDQVAEHEAELTAYALEKLNHIDGLTIYGSRDPAKASGRLGVIPFNLEGVPHGLVAAILSTEWGIGVRNGCFCAHPYVTKLLGVSPAEIKRFADDMTHDDRRRVPGVVRISFGIYNTKQEIDTLEEALKSIAGKNYKGRYQQEKDSGDFYALGWEPRLESFFKV